MKNARFKARSFDKNKYDKSDKRSLSDSSSVKKLPVARV